LNRKTLENLGYFKLIDVLKGFTQSTLGAAVCEELLPFSDFDMAVKEGKRVSQLKRFLKEVKNIPFDGVTDIKTALNLARIENSALDIDSILNVKENLVTARKLKSFLSEVDGEEYSYLVEFTDKLHPVKKIENLIKSAVGANGEILDSASTELGRIRRQIKDKREDVIGSLSKVMTDKRTAVIIQEQIITMRNDRYVLVVKPNFNEHFKGIIHGDSQSGASYYVEPFSLVEDNNKLNFLLKLEKKEELKVIRKITAEIGACYDLLIENLEALSDFDFLSAKSRLSEALDLNEASLGRSDDGEINLKNARHPLLYFDSLYRKKDDAVENKDVIPIDIKFDKNKRGMVLSGANSGGKTAALKTLGLVSFMAKAGMHISADEESSLIFFDKIYADIGDDQDILKSKGTFSSHLTNIKEITDDTDKDTLILLDELGTGTNPTEGSALFSALLDYLISKGCYFVATTHLDKIKHYAYINNAVENVSVAFNEDTLKPEYKLIYNQIGRSNALSLAKQMGFSESILIKAKGYMTDDELNLSELIKELTVEKSDLLRKKDEIAAIKRGSLELKEKRKKMFSEFKEKKDLLLKKKEKEMSNVFYETKKRLKEIVKRHEADKAGDIQAFEDVAVLRKNVKKKFFLPRRSGNSTENLKKNDNVYVKSLNKNGIILKLDEKRKTALVNVGSLKVDIPVCELKKRDVKRENKAGAVNLNMDISSHVKHELNIIGKTIDEALPIIDRFLDDAYLSNLGEVTIIHGKGTGRLKTGVLKHLLDAPYVAGIVEGKDIVASAGATIVKIKQ
jgi:DNA mismatch repair protein MutS2